MDANATFTIICFSIIFPNLVVIYAGVIWSPPENAHRVDKQKYWVLFLMAFFTINYVIFTSPGVKSLFS